jgi:hypothetical protein
MDEACFRRRVPTPPRLHLPCPPSAPPTGLSSKPLPSSPLSLSPPAAGSPGLCAAADAPGFASPAAAFSGSFAASASACGAQPGSGMHRGDRHS